jgi:YD repeat-containing protein
MSNTAQLRDEQGHLLGVIEQLADGNRLARDPQGRLLGGYNARANATRDRTGRLVGEGDLLALLLGRATW